MPAGFPKGQTALHDGEGDRRSCVRAGRDTWKYARKPFDPVQSGHATHVAGIAAGNAGTDRDRRRQGLGHRAARLHRQLQGAERPDRRNVGLDGNAPEIVAAIEAAVADGMNVINLSTR